MSKAGDENYVPNQSSHAPQTEATTCPLPTPTPTPSVNTPTIGTDPAIFNTHTHYNHFILCVTKECNVVPNFLKKRTKTNAPHFCLLIFEPYTLTLKKTHKRFLTSNLDSMIISKCSQWYMEERNFNEIS